MKIKLKFSKGELFNGALLNVCYNANQFLSLSNSDVNIIDLSDCSWTTPLSILPVASLITYKQESNYIVWIKKPKASRTKSYLDIIHFPKGISKPCEIKKYKDRNYTPIVYFLNSVSTMRTTENVINCLRGILTDKIGPVDGLADAITYSISEIFNDNIREHSQSKYGWFSAQYYPTKEYLDMCIVDNGITIKGSYIAQNIRVKDDSEAIKLALEGKSSKTEERGFGLRTTKNIITKSLLNGKFLIVSGSAGYYANKKKQQFFSLNPYWHGTIVSIRINKVKGRIDIYRYLE